MENFVLKIIKMKFPILIALFLSVVLSVFAYSPYYTHPDLTEEIAKLWNLKNSNQNLRISQEEIQ